MPVRFIITIIYIDPYGMLTYYIRILLMKLKKKNIKLNKRKASFIGKLQFFCTGTVFFFYEII